MIGGVKVRTFSMEDLSKNYVVKSNSLIEAHYHLNKVHQKIILLLASYVKPNATEFEPITFKTKDLMEIIGISDTNHSYLRKVTKDLKSKVIELITDNGTYLDQVNWLDKSKYHLKEGKVTLMLHNDLRPFILQLSGHFTKYKLATIINFSSTYSIRIYELLIQYKKIGERSIKLSKLRMMLNVEGKYKLFADFRRKVLDVSQKELKEKSEICFEYDVKKKNKAVDEIVFTIEDNKSKVKNNPIEKIGDNYGNEFADILLNNLSNNHDTELYEVLGRELNLAQADIDKLIGDHTKEKLWEKYHYYHYKKSTTDIKNPTAWFINAVIKDYSTADMKQSKAIPDIDWSGFNLDETRLTDLKNELKRLNDALKEAQENLASPVSQYSSALREQYQREIKDTQIKIADIQKEIMELESRVN